MAEYIDKKAALEYIIFGVVGRNITCGELRGAIEHLPTVEIVRCKDCKHRQEDVGMGDHCWCDIANGSRHSDDFCSYGERKDNE